MMTTEVISRQDAKRQLPDGWRWVRLGEIAQLKNGVNFTNTQKGRGILTVDVLNMYSDSVYLKMDGLYRVDVQVSEEYLLQPNDILFVRSSVKEEGVAWPALFPGYTEPVTFCGFLIRAKLTTADIYPEFLINYFRSSFVRSFLVSKSGRGTITNINQGSLQELSIPLPPLAEQKRIAAILNEQMEAVERSRIATSAQLDAAKALPAAYLRAVFNNPKAQEWSRKRIGDFAHTSSGTTPPRERKDYYVGSIPWVKTGELQDNVIDDTEEHVSEAALRETSLKLLPAGTLLIAMYGQGLTRGRTGLLASPATTNQACFAILPNSEEFDPLYLQWWFRHSYTRLRRETEGRGGNQPNLNGDVLRSQKVPLPPLVEQKRIVAVMTEKFVEVERLHKVLEEQLDAINQLPATLLRRAFNGEL